MMHLVILWNVEMMQLKPCVFTMPRGLMHLTNAKFIRVLGLIIEVNLKEGDQIQADGRVFITRPQPCLC